MSEKIPTQNIFDQIYNETEKVYVPRTPELLDKFRSIAPKRILQPYLSDTTEPYSLRLRSTTKSGTKKYDATLKTAGQITAAGKSRSEFTGGLSDERFNYYTAGDLPTVRKTRVLPMESIDIDFFDDGDTWVESENPEAWTRFLDHHRFDTDDFVDMTGHAPDNELRAHVLYRREHGGRNAFATYRPFDTDIALDAILPYAKSRIQLSRGRLTVVRITGRSGSGKSHHLSVLREELKSHDVDSYVISIDDYNIGMKKLLATNNGEYPRDFDLQNVYDIEQARTDLQELLAGRAIRQYAFDWRTSEPRYLRTVDAPGDGTVLFLEGIWARHDAFERADITLDIDTPLATSLGQRITRDMRERAEFAEPEKSMHYYLEHAEPAYRAG